jgi:hypothetical protein
MYNGTYKVTYIDKENGNFVKTQKFDTLQKAISFTNQKSNINQILELKFYGSEESRKPGRT